MHVRATSFTLPVLCLYLFKCWETGSEKFMNYLKTTQLGRGKAQPLTMRNIHSHVSQHKTVSRVSIPETLSHTGSQFAGSRPKGVAGRSRRLQREAKGSGCRTFSGLPVGPCAEHILRTYRHFHTPGL